ERKHRCVRVLPTWRFSEALLPLAASFKNWKHLYLADNQQNTKLVISSREAVYPELVEGRDLDFQYKGRQSQDSSSATRAGMTVFKIKTD
ncbi:MAG: hypothetical protein AB8F95_12275, partial [Bacteroidia bacterium]